MNPYGNNRRYRVSFEIDCHKWDPAAGEFTILDEEDTLEMWVPADAVVEEIQPPYINGWYRYTNPRNPELHRNEYYLWADDSGNIQAYRFEGNFSRRPPELIRMIGVVDWESHGKHYQPIGFTDVEVDDE